MTGEPEQWGKPPQARKYHIFDEDGRSLCGDYGFFGADRGDPFDADEDTFRKSRDCTRCARKAGLTE